MIREWYLNSYINRGKDTYISRFVTILFLGDEEPNNSWEMNAWKIALIYGILLGKQATGFIPNIPKYFLESLCDLGYL